MIHWFHSQSKKGKILIISAIFIILAYYLLWPFIQSLDPVKKIISAFSDSYLSLTEECSNLILKLTAHPLKFENHRVFLDQTIIPGFESKLNFMVSGGILFFLIWYERTTYLKKIFYSALVILINYLLISFYNSAGAYLSIHENTDPALLAIPLSLGHIILLAFALLWFKSNKESILTNQSVFKLDTILNERKIYELFLVIFLYIVVIHFVSNYFDFYHWINIMLHAAQKIVATVGFDSEIEPYYLTGANGSVYMSKGCLGIKTLFLFSAVIFLTGSKNIKLLFYILGGLLILNFINILRIAFIYIYIQKNGVTSMAIDLHDYSVSIIHLIVVFLWIIWFRKSPVLPDKK